MKVKEKIVGTILIELKNNSKSIGALSLKSGYVLTKYTVKNKKFAVYIRHGYVQRAVTIG